jgi:2-polyprenyl-3-methyl-5-hydroxy-6-metoxy-1,4-benzoquinol methylase
VRVQRYVIDRIGFIVEHARGRRVLDCGVIGSTLMPASEQLANLPQSLHWRIAAVAQDAVGIDVADVVEEANVRYPQLNLVKASAEDLSDLEGPFDLVVLGDLIEHVSNPGLVLDEARSIIHTAGEIIITCPNALGAPNYLRFLLGRFREGLEHVTAHNKWTISQLLQRHGFTVREIHTCLDRDPANAVRRRTFRLLAFGLRLMPELGGTLIVVARRTR